MTVQNAPPGKSTGAQASIIQASPPLPTPDQLDQMLSFLIACGDLKDTLRSAHTNSGRVESTAEHSWRLGLWLMVLAPYLTDYDLLAMHKMALVHDLGEAVTGDIPAIHQSGDQTARKIAESKALADLTAQLAPLIATDIQETAAAYDNASNQGPDASKEALFMKGLDKLETLLQHASGKNPADFDYVFNLTYGAQQTRGGTTQAQVLLERIRAKIDIMTKDAILKQKNRSGQT